MLSITALLHCITLTAFIIAAKSEVPPPCQYRNEPPDFIVDCASRGYIHPPPGLPSNLTMLFLNNNKIYHVDRNYLEQFPRITHLDFSYNKNLGLDNVSESFYGLQNSNISVINITNIVSEYSNDNCVKLKSQFFKYIKNTPLTAIFLDRNWIHLVEPHSLKGAPKSLEILSMWNSRLLFTPNVLKQLAFLINLRKFDLTARNIGSKVIALSNEDEENNNILTLIREKRNAQISNLEDFIPFGLEELIFDKCSFETGIPKMTFGKNSLKRISLRQNRIEPIIGPVTGLDELEEFDFSDNNCYTIPDECSRLLPAPKLKKLIVKGNNFDLSDKEHVFDHWKNLTMLDASFNKISIVPHKVFDKLALLEQLSLKGNIIYDFRVNLIQFKNLLLLDLSENQISHLSESVTSQLDAIREGSNLTLDLRGNPIKCSCDDAKLNFIRWFVKTKVDIVQKSKMTCSTDNSKEGTKIIELYRTELERKCQSPTSYYGLAMGTAVVVTGSMCFMLMCLIYRYRYKLAYYYFIGRRRYQNRSVNDDEYNALFAFDAYIAYADEDRVDFALHTFIEKLEKDQKLTLCFRDRNFLPGEVIASSILSAIQASRRVVLVLSSDFLKSTWRRYEFEMAQCESIERAQSMVVLVKYKDFPLNDVPKNMLRMLDTQTYLEYPETEEDQEVFWKTMMTALSDA